MKKTKRSGRSGASRAVCVYCHGYGLAADLWGAGYRWPLNKEQAVKMLARVNCDRCGTGGTESGERVAERARQKLAATKHTQRKTSAPFGTPDERES